MRDLFFQRLRCGAAIAAPLLMALPRPAAAQLGGVFVCVNCADEPTTLQMQAEQILQYIQEAGTALNTYQHLQLMIREVEQLATHPSTNIALDLNTFAGIVAQSQAIALDAAQMSVGFNNLFAPFAATPLVSYAAQYNTWAASALASIRAAAVGAGAEGDMMQNEQVWMQNINLMNQATNGMDQGIQITNVVGLETVAQLQRLRMLMAADLAQQSTFMTTVLNTQQTNVNNDLNAFTDTGSVADQRGW
jgi:type IV secretion system protein TrbJ